MFYQSHDVTSLFVEGRNTIGAVVTPGWWAGAIAKGIYGSPETGFIAKLVITYDDNTTGVIVTDGTWASSRKGAVKSGDIYDGEVYDARIVTDWNGSDISTWNAVAENTGFNGVIEAEKGPFVKVLDDNILSVKTATIYEGTAEGSGDYGMYVTLIGLAALFFFASAHVLPTARNNSRAIAAALDKARADLEIYLRDYPDFPLPARYAHPATLTRMIRSIREGRSETIPEAYEDMKAVLRSLNSDVKVSQTEYDEVVAIKPMFLLENYR